MNGFPTRESIHSDSDSVLQLVELPAQNYVAPQEISKDGVEMKHNFNLSAKTFDRRKRMGYNYEQPHKQ